MSQINIRNLSNENDDGAPDIVGISTFSAISYVVPPVGTTLQRPENPQGGDLRFNTDTASLEYFRGDAIGWSQIEMTSPDLNGGARAIAFGGNNGSAYTDIEYFTISTLGDAIDFGDFATARNAAASCASRTRGIVATGQEPGTVTADIDYVTISSTGGSTDFGGDVTDSRDFSAGLSNQIRGIFGGGRISNPSTAGNVIDYITIASGGDAVDFGDTRNTSLWYPMLLASQTRGIFGSGKDGSENSDIDFITISTTGNAVEFGDLNTNHGGVGVSNSTRGLFAGGYNPGLCNKITYITIATTGNTTTFGDLTRDARGLAAASSRTRACFIGGKSPANSNVIDYVQIATEATALDFGDLAQSNNGEKGNVAACSNAHGGL